MLGRPTVLVRHRIGEVACHTHSRPAQAELLLRLRDHAVDRRGVKVPKGMHVDIRRHARRAPNGYRGMADRVRVWREHSARLIGEHEAIRLEIPSTVSGQRLLPVSEVSEGSKGLGVDGDTADAPAVFGLFTVALPRPATTDSSMRTVPDSRLTSDHRSAQASPRRTPVAATRRSNPPRRSSRRSAAAIKARTSSAAAPEPEFGARRTCMREARCQRSDSEARSRSTCERGDRLGEASGGCGGASSAPLLRT